MVCIRIPKLSSKHNSISAYVDECIMLHYELMKAYADGIKLLMPSLNTELEEEKTNNFHLRCLLIRKDVIERIYNLHQRYDIELYIYRYNMWINYGGTKENIIFASNAFIETRSEYTPRLIRKIKIEETNATALLSMLMKTLANMYDETATFIARAYQESNFISSDIYQELIKQATSFLHTSMKEIEIIALHAVAYINQTRAYKCSVYFYIQGLELFIARDGCSTLKLA